ncbi:MAG: hypothetical protein QOH28_2312 [Actinomycetota bacterium]|nr:hypothetical protein [Actinomycetota bacterium]
MARLTLMPKRRESVLHRATAIVLSMFVALTLASCTQIRAELASSSSASAPPNATESQIIDAVNSFRGAHGLGALSVHSNLEDKAHLWAAWMAGGNCGGGASAPTICHSDVASGITVSWTLLEENVGAAAPATNIAGLESGFEGSAEHAANMLNARITSIGVGVAYAGDTLFVAEEFMAQ